MATIRINVPLSVVLVLQAIWTGVLSARGWFYQDDLSAMHEASGRSLDWGFLTRPEISHRERRKEEGQG